MLKNQNEMGSYEEGNSKFAAFDQAIPPDKGIQKAPLIYPSVAHISPVPSTAPPSPPKPPPDPDSLDSEEGDSHDSHSKRRGSSHRPSTVQSRNSFFGGNIPPIPPPSPPPPSSPSSSDHEPDNLQ